MHVPAPGALWISTRPSRKLSRSRIENRPNPPGVQALATSAVRVEAGPLVRDAQPQQPAGLLLEFHSRLIDLGVLDHVEQQFPHRLEQQDLDVLGRHGHMGFGHDLDLQAVLLVHPLAQPAQGRSQPAVAQDRRAQFDGQRARGLDRLAQDLAGLPQRLLRGSILASAPCSG